MHSRVIPGEAEVDLVVEILLLDVGQEHRLPGVEGPPGGVEGARRREGRLGLVVVVQPQADLLEVVGGLDSPDEPAHAALDQGFPGGQQPADLMGDPGGRDPGDEHQHDRADQGDGPAGPPAAGWRIVRLGPRLHLAGEPAEEEMRANQGERPGRRQP